MKAPRSQGFSIVEILVAVGIFVTAVVAFAASFTTFTTLTRHTAERTQTALLLEEGAEAVQLLRDAGWDTYIAPLANDTPYHFYWDGSAYVATVLVLISGTYARTITLTEARRDGADQIADAGTVDENTRRVTIDIYRAADDALLASGGTLIHNVYDAD